MPPKLAEGIHRPFDELLDLYVRDGFVYYNAVRSDRGRLDQYIRTLDGATGVQQSKGSREEQIAFWVNAYNAFVLQTVADQLSDSRARQGISRDQHPADSRRLRQAHVPRRWPIRDARRDREGHPGPARRRARVPRARTRRGRRRPVAERGLRPEAAERTARCGGRRVPQAQRDRQGRCGRRAVERHAAVLVAGGGLRRVLRRQGPRDLQAAQPARASGARADPAAPGGSRGRIPREEHLQDGVPRLRLAAERSAATVRTDLDGCARSSLKIVVGVRRRRRLVADCWWNCPVLLPAGLCRQNRFD